MVYGRQRVAGMSSRAAQRILATASRLEKSVQPLLGLFLLLLDTVDQSARTFAGFVNRRLVTVDVLNLFAGVLNPLQAERCRRALQEVPFPRQALEVALLPVVWARRGGRS